MKWWRGLESAAFFFIIGASLAAGLAASYGRELEAHRRPDRSWWLRRLLIIPLLAIAATAATEAFGLSTSFAAFTAAMLSLGGYDALRFVEARWINRLQAEARTAEPETLDAEGGSPGPRPRS